MMLYAPDIAQIFDMKFNKPFAVRHFNNENDLIGFFFFDPDKGLRNASNNDVSKNVLLKLLDGEYYIDKDAKPEAKKEKFKPRVGERYWYIPLPNHTEESDIFGGPKSFERSLSSNFFRTREEARKGKKKIVEQYKAFSRECNEYIENKKRMGEFPDD